jgi:hypothetical protein
MAACALAATKASAEVLLVAAYPAAAEGCEATPVFLVREHRIDVECTEEPTRCTASVKMVVHNPSAEPKTLAIAGVRGLRVEGRQAVWDAPRDAISLLDRVVRCCAYSRDDCNAASTEPIVKAATLVSFEPGSDRTLELRGIDMHATPSGWHRPHPDEDTFGALLVRHILLSRVAERGVAHFDYSVRSGRRWARGGPTVVRIRTPASWDADVELEKSITSRGEASIAPPAAQSTRAGVYELRYAEFVDGSLSVSVETPEPSIIDHGGPYVGFGAVLGESGRGLARAGYEMGWHDRLDNWDVIVALAADVDFEGAVAVAPSVEMTLPQLALFPSLSLGLGVPLRVHPAADVGVRGLFGVQLLPLGVVLSVDYYPVAEPDPVIDVALIGRASF